MTRIQILEKQIKDWKIKYENLAAAKKISEENLSQEIVCLKKELAAKDKIIDSLYEIIGRLDRKVEELTAQVAELTKENAALKEIIIIQNDQITKLKSRLNKDSNNSNKPPSTDGFKKPIQNNREKTGKKVGGQLGHKGYGLIQFANPTNIIEKKVLVCDDCNGDVQNSVDYIAKQLVDIEIKLNVWEERVYTGTCIKCGKKHTGTFSKEYINPVQYGNNIKSLITVLNSHGFVPVNKTRDILNSITGNKLNISGATIVNIQNSLSRKLEKILESIKNNLISCKVLNADETGCRLNSKTNWIQVFSNNMFTLCGHNNKRGSVSIRDMGILDYFIGILVHDHFSSYYKNNLVTHAECNVHILRYLKGILEVFKHGWTQEMITLLTEVLKIKKEYIASGKTSFEPAKLNEISEKYDFILSKGQQEYEESIRGKKKISYSNDERLLLKRLQEYKSEHLRFITNFDAPFDNNQAERDLRPFKTKTKVSGCFRSNKGLEAFTKVYSLISTLKKQNKNIYSNILDIFSGKELTFT
jgi:transposase